MASSCRRELTASIATGSTMKSDLRSLRLMKCCFILVKNKFSEERPQNYRKLDGDLTDLNEHFVVDIPMSARVYPSCRNVIAVLIAITFGQELLAECHVRVSKQSCKQANRLILWGVRSTTKKKISILLFYFLQKKLKNMI